VEEHGLHRGADHLLEEDLGEAEEDPHLQGEDLLLEEGGHRHLEGEVDQAEGRDHRPEGLGDPQLGHQEAGLVVQLDAGGTHHLAALTRLAEQLSSRAVIICLPQKLMV